MSTAREQLRRSRRVVVKIGSALLAADGGAAFERLAAQIALAWTRGVEVVVVSSGAIALGLKPMGFQKRPTDLAGLQAAAAAGQSRLMWRWAEAFGGHGRDVAQILLTHADLEERRRYLNARQAFGRLLGAGVVPVVNENDTVSVDEIKFGDNDTLAADVAGICGADLVVLLTTVDGLYDADPRVVPTAARIDVVDKVDDSIRGVAGGAGPFGTGGMVTKVRAAERARTHGAATVVAPGAVPNVLLSVLDGESVGTLFVGPTERPGPARKRWIATALRPSGSLVLDEGAVRAVSGQSSLLYAGIREVRGQFDAGDAVELLSAAGQVVGQGLVALSAAELSPLVGLRTADAQARYTGPLPDEVVHRDDLAVF